MTFLRVLTLVCLVSSAALQGETAPQNDAISEDVGVIAFQSGRSGTTQIHVMKVDGSDVHQVTNDPATNTGPTLSPDGATIAYVSSRDGNDKIYIIDTGGGNPRRLTKTTGNESDPTWSPDGKRIYYRRMIDNEKVAIFSINTDGSGDHQLTDGSVRFLGLSVSPDGGKMLSTARGGIEVWVMNSDGSTANCIARKSEMVLYPRWSPDGRKIVYGKMIGFPPNHKTQICVMNSDGSGDVALTDAGSISEYPCWSPDGRQIAFQTSRDGNFEIYTMKAEGSELRRLTNHASLDGRPS